MGGGMGMGHADGRHGYANGGGMPLMGGMRGMGMGGMGMGMPMGYGSRGYTLESARRIKRAAVGSLAEQSWRVRAMLGRLNSFIRYEQ